MTKIKINSNPYKQEIKYETYKENTQEWVEVGQYSPNGKLNEENARKCFLPFNAKEILEIIKEPLHCFVISSLRMNTVWLLFMIMKNWQTSFYRMRFCK